MNTHYDLLPKKIRIGQRTFKVVVKTKKGTSGRLAYFDPNKELIAVREGLSLGLLRSSLFHEILHAIGDIYRNYGPKIRDKKKGEDYQDYWYMWEHLFLYMYDENVVMVLRDNPELVTLLLSSDDNDTSLL